MNTSCCLACSGQSTHWQSVIFYGVALHRNQIELLLQHRKSAAGSVAEKTTPHESLLLKHSSLRTRWTLYSESVYLWPRHLVAWAGTRRGCLISHHRWSRQRLNERLRRVGSVNPAVYSVSCHANHVLYIWLTTFVFVGRWLDAPVVHVFSCGNCHIRFTVRLSYEVAI